MQTVWVQEVVEDRTPLENSGGDRPLGRSGWRPGHVTGDQDQSLLSGVWDQRLATVQQDWRPVAGVQEWRLVTTGRQAGELGNSCRPGSEDSCSAGT